MAIQVTAGTTEEVALRLMEMVAFAEGKVLLGTNPDALGGRTEKADRDWIMTTYRDCRRLVLGRASPGPEGTEASAKPARRMGHANL